MMEHDLLHVHFNPLIRQGRPHTITVILNWKPKP
jgi:hypothetical protein